MSALEKARVLARLATWRPRSRYGSGGLLGVLELFLGARATPLQSLPDFIPEVPWKLIYLNWPPGRRPKPEHRSFVSPYANVARVDVMHIRGWGFWRYTWEDGDGWVEIQALAQSRAHPHQALNWGRSVRHPAVFRYAQDALGASSPPRSVGSRRGLP